MPEQNLKLSKEKAALLFAFAKKIFPEIDLSAVAMDGEFVVFSKKDADILLKSAADRLHEIDIQSALLTGERDKILMLKGKLTGGKNLFDGL